MEKLALFDIDYTITRKETLMEFYKYVVSRDIKNIKFLRNICYILDIADKISNICFTSLYTSLNSIAF